MPTDPRAEHDAVLSSLPKVGYPHELRWHLSPGTHVIRARLAQSGETTAAVTVTVDD